MMDKKLLKNNAEEKKNVCGGKKVREMIKGKGTDDRKGG